MNYVNFKYALILFLLLLTSFHTLAGENKHDGISALAHKLIPSYVKIQAYGGMGTLSAGPGWKYFNNKLETDILVGFVPRYNSKSTKITFTFKENFIPWKIDLNDFVELEPLTTGIYLNVITGKEFWNTEPERYPKDYYGFSTRTRLWIYAGQRINFTPANRNLPKIGLFYEISSNELYIVSAVSDRSWKLQDFLRLSFGIKIEFQKE